ncbi:hypothetical protein [Herbiconiux liangxiaofengii]|uniref:hypothetical protein n=1 Tax=Herbiconiux liangxiaofengii TaxID=3342795 RepID=UPI0035B8B93E
MTARRVTRAAGSAALIMAGVALSGCGPIEYHGQDSGIDGVLWRQIAGFEDPANFYESSTQVPETYLAEAGVDRWDGSLSTRPDVGEGAILIYDVSTSGAEAEFSVFVSSGPRPDTPTDSGHDYSGPSQVYTCYEIAADLGSPTPAVERTIFTTCPEALVSLLPQDAAFASADTYDG